MWYSVSVSDISDAEISEAKARADKANVDIRKKRAFISRSLLQKITYYQNQKPSWIFSLA